MKDIKRILTIIVAAIMIMAFPIIIFTKSDFGFLNENEASSILGYFGSIIGGLFTIYGVVITIKQERMEKQSDLAIQYKPMIVIDNIVVRPSNFDIIIVNSEYHFINNNETIDVESNCNCFFFDLVNVGRGEAIDLKASVDVDDECCYKTFKEVNNEGGIMSDNHLPTNRKKTLSFYFSSIPDNFKPFYFNLHIEYTDLYKQHKYEEHVKFLVTTKTIKGNRIIVLASWETESGTRIKEP